MSDEIKLESPLVLKFSESERKFNDLGELQEFMESERDAWLWLEKVYQLNKALEKVREPFNRYIGEVSEFIGEYQKHQSNQKYIDESLSDLKNKTQFAVHQGLILSDSAEAQFIFKIKDSKDWQTAAYSLAFIKKIKIDFSTALAIEGAYWAMQHKQGSTETVEAHQKALELMKHSWVVKFGKKHKELQEKNDELISEIEGLRNKFNSLILEVEAQKTEQKESFETELKKAQEKLADIERTYDEKLALQSSVEYWDKKRVHHQFVMWWMAMVTAFCAAAITGIFVWVAYDLFEATTLSEVQLWKLGVMLAISSFGVWLVRLLSKIFISNLHLRTDADERVTMIKTYLALLREGSGPKDDERQLILQTLFRPSSTGFIKEDGPTGFYEAILNRGKKD